MTARVGVTAGRGVGQDQGHPGLEAENLDQDPSQAQDLDRDPNLDQDQGLDQGPSLDQDLRVGPDQDQDLLAQEQGLVRQNQNLVLPLGQDPDLVQGQGQGLLVLEQDLAQRLQEQGQALQDQEQGQDPGLDQVHQQDHGLDLLNQGQPLQQGLNKIKTEEC